MLALNEYLQISKKVIKKHGIRTMLFNEDAVAYIAHYLMKADSIYDDKIGTIEGFRASYGKYAIKNWINRHHKNKRFVSMPISVEENIQSSESVVQNVCFNEIMEYINLLPKPKGDIIKMYYFDRLSLRAIGKKVNLSGERINQILNNTLERIKEKFND